MKFILHILFLGFSVIYSFGSVEAMNDYEMGEKNYVNSSRKKTEMILKVYPSQNVPFDVEGEADEDIIEALRVKSFLQIDTPYVNVSLKDFEKGEEDEEDDEDIEDGSTLKDIEKQLISGQKNLFDITYLKSVSHKSNSICTNFFVKIFNEKNQILKTLFIPLDMQQRLIKTFAVSDCWAYGCYEFFVDVFYTKKEQDYIMVLDSERDMMSTAFTLLPNTNLIQLKTIHSLTEGDGIVLFKKKDDQKKTFEIIHFAIVLGFVDGNKVFVLEKFGDSGSFMVQTLQQMIDSYKADAVCYIPYAQKTKPLCDKIKYFYSNDPLKQIHEVDN